LKVRFSTARLPVWTNPVGNASGPAQFTYRVGPALSVRIRRKDIPAKLERALNIAKPYELLNADDVREFVEIHSVRRTPYPNPKELLRKTTDLFWLGDVYFNQGHTLALTAISTYCGPTCGSMTWKIFEKSSTGRWEERPWVTCGSIARTEENTQRRELREDAV